MRFWVAVFFIGLPLLLVMGWMLDPSAYEIHATGSARPLVAVLLIALVGTPFLMGIYYVFLEKTIELDFGSGLVTRTIRVCGATIQRKAWPLSEFQRVVLRSSHCGDDVAPDTQTDVGIRHSKGFVLWLRSFLSKEGETATDALDFTRQLQASTGLQA